MIRTSEFGVRSATCLAAIACVFGLAAAAVTLADGASSPAPASLARSRTRAHAGAVAPRPGAAGLPRAASAPTAAHRPTPSPSDASTRAGLVEGDLPTAGSRGSLQATGDPSIARSTDGLVMQVLPDGSRRVNLQGRFRAYSAVTIAADGALRMACADDQAAALALAAAAAHLPAPRTHRAAFGPREE